MKLKNRVKNILFYIIPAIVLIFNIIIILEPNLVINSARSGLLLWFNKILPSLLPFIIGTNLLIRLGFIDFLGTLLENIMQKIFHVSGAGAFPLILGMFSGYPIGAKIVCDLRINKKISKSEGERLLVFTNNSGPLFILGTVGIGMFGSEKLGYLIMIIHYISAITTGILFRNYKYDKSYIRLEKVSIKKALKNLKKARKTENKSFGEILGESIKNALEVTVIVGGFVIFFSVISEMFLNSNIFTYLGEKLLPNNIKNLSNGIFIGLIEMTNGCNILSQNKSILSVIFAVCLISWSGFSIHAQTFSIISKTDLSSKVYIISKIIHTIITFFYSLLLISLINNYLSYKETLNISKNIIINPQLTLIISIIIIIITFGILFNFISNYILKSK